MTKSRAIFKTIDEKRQGLIRCVNKNTEADLKTEGVGTINLLLDNKGEFNLQNVIYSANLTENLLSLRRFAEMGLSIYLVDKKIDIVNQYRIKLLSRVSMKNHTG